jgi:hypothetical protein
VNPWIARKRTPACSVVFFDFNDKRSDEEMIELTNDNFHQVVANEPRVLVLFTGDPKEGDQTAFTALCDSISNPAPWHRGVVNALSSPDIAAMFGISNRLPALLIMRDQVVLYCDPIDMTSGGEIRTIINRAAALNMETVHRNIRELRNNQAWLFERRVCPASRRRR